MKKYLKISLLTTFIVILLIFIIYQVSVIKKVFIISENSDIKGLHIIEGKNLILLDNQSLIDFLLKNNPNINKIFINKSIPNNLIIQIIPRIPIAIVSNDRISMYVDEEGIYLTDLSDLGPLPKIEIANIPIYSDRKADWRVIKALLMLKYFENGYISIQKVVIDDNNNMYTFRLLNDIQVLVPYNADASKLAASLQIIISRFRIEGKTISLIDFRYDKPIVVLSNEVKKSSILK